jgi:hypothetical protein
MEEELKVHHDLTNKLTMISGKINSLKKDLGNPELSSDYDQIDDWCQEAFLALKRFGKYLDKKT